VPSRCFLGVLVFILFLVVLSLGVLLCGVGFFFFFFFLGCMSGFSGEESV